MKYVEIKDLDPKTLHHRLGELRRELFELRVEKHMKKQARGLQKHHELRTKRRDMARILTALNSTKKQAK